MTASPEGRPVAGTSARSGRALVPAVISAVTGAALAAAAGSAVRPLTRRNLVRALHSCAPEDAVNVVKDSACQVPA